MVYKGRWHRKLGCLCVRAHTRKQGQRQIRCHSDCHEGDKLCQVLSLRGEKMRGGAQYGPNTHKVLYGDTTTHIQTWNDLLAGRQADTHTHTVRRCYWWIHQSRAHQGASKLFDSKSLSTPPLKKTSSENQLVDLVQGCRGDWLRIAKFLLSIHLGINRTEERELAIFSSLLILKPWDTAIPPVIGKLLFGCQTCKQVWAHTHAAAAAAAGKNNLPENSWMPNILFMFFRVFRVVENKKLCI